MNFTEAIINILIILVIGAAVFGASSQTFKAKLAGYRFQSSLLFPLAIFTAIVPSSNGLFALVAFFPLIRVFVIRPLMALATVEPEPEPPSPHAASVAEQLKQRWRQFSDVTWAENYWLEYGAARINLVWSLLGSASLILLAYVVAGQLAGDESLREINGLGASLSLLLIGLGIMITEKDMPSHILGLLVMENGLFLAAVTFITTTFLILAFFVSLFAYIIITLLILAVFSPRLHRMSGSVYVGDQTELDEPYKPNELS